MHEQRIVELITRKLALEATPEELGELSYLLTKYPESLYYEALLEHAWNEGKTSDAEDLSVIFEKHKQKFKKDLDFQVEKKPLKDHFYRPVLAYAALICILSVLGIYFFNFDNDIQKDIRIDIIAGRGIRKQITLPDGTQVRLNSGSKLSYDIDIQSQSQRNVILVGEAFFKVAKDKKRPFVVRTGQVSIKVLGTEFNVKDYPGDSKAETTLMEGSIELTINGRAEQKFFLKPSEKLALVKNKNQTHNIDSSSVLMIGDISPVKVGEIEYIQEISWTENKFVFENESFEDLLPKLERWYNVRIILKDPIIRSYRFTGIFTNENIIQALQAMQLIKSFNYKLNDNEVKIY